MQALKYETIIKSDHRLSIDLPSNFPEGLAEVIVLAKTEAAPQVTESLIDYLDWLKTQPPTGRSAAEILAQVEGERASWGDN